MSKLPKSRKEAPDVSKSKVCKTNTGVQVRHPFGILCTLQAGSDDCVSSAIVRIPLLVGRYTCACFYELEWLPSRTQTRQRKRPFSYLKRRRRNNYHCCLSVVLCLTAFPHPLHSSSLLPPFLPLSPSLFTSCFSIPLTICLSTFHLISFCYSLFLSPFLFFRKCGERHRWHHYRKWHQ